MPRGRPRKTSPVQSIGENQTQNTESVSAPLTAPIAEVIENLNDIEALEGQMSEDAEEIENDKQTRMTAKEEMKRCSSVVNKGQSHLDLVESTLKTIGANFKRVDDATFRDGQVSFAEGRTCLIIKYAGSGLISSFNFNADGSYDKGLPSQT